MSKIFIGAWPCENGMPAYRDVSYCPGLSETKAHYSWTIGENSPIIVEDSSSENV